MGLAHGPPTSLSIGRFTSVHTPQPRPSRCPPPRARGGLSPCAPLPPPRRREAIQRAPWPWRLTPRRPPPPHCAFPTLRLPPASPRLSLGAAAGFGSGSTPAGGAGVCRGAGMLAPTCRAWGVFWAAYSAAVAATTGRRRGRSTPTPWRASTPWSPRSPRFPTPTCERALPRSRSGRAPESPLTPSSPYVPKRCGLSHRMLSV